MPRPRASCRAWAALRWSCSTMSWPRTRWTQPLVPWTTRSQRRGRQKGAESAGRAAARRRRRSWGRTSTLRCMVGGGEAGRGMGVRAVGVGAVCARLRPLCTCTQAASKCARSLRLWRTSARTSATKAAQSWKVGCVGCKWHRVASLRDSCSLLLLASSPDGASRNCSQVQTRTRTRTQGRSRLNWMPRWQPLALCSVSHSRAAVSCWMGTAPRPWSN